MESVISQENVERREVKKGQDILFCCTLFSQHGVLHFHSTSNHMHAMMSHNSQHAGLNGQTLPENIRAPFFVLNMSTFAHFDWYLLVDWY